MTVRNCAKAEKTDTGINVIIEDVTIGIIGHVTEEHGPDHVTGNQVGGQDHVIERADVQDQETGSLADVQDLGIENDDQGPWSGIGIGIGEIELLKGVCSNTVLFKKLTHFFLNHGFF